MGGALALALLLATPAQLALAASAKDVFTVADVPLDATAASANAARDAARVDGERRAYAQLFSRLTLAADHDRMPAANEAMLNDLISGFEVAKERSSSVRYLANYTFHFRAAAMRALLKKAGFPFAETPSRPLVVLAVSEGGTAPVLWDDPNPWRDAWGAHPPAPGLVPLILPVGDLEDVQAIAAEAAVAGDDGGLKAISEHYGGADVLVARVQLDTAVTPHTLAATSTRFSIATAQPPESWTKSFAAAAGESDGDLLGRVVASTAAQVEEAWKQANILDFKHTGTIVVRVPAPDLQSWVAVRDRLTGIPAIARSELVSIDRGEARVALHYVGDPAQLRVALAQRDLELQGDDPDFVLAQRGSGAPH